MLCPQCQANIQEDFGLVHCSSCGAQFLLGVDGVEEFSQAKNDVVENTFPSISTGSVSDSAIHSDNFTQVVAQDHEPMTEVIESVDTDSLETQVLSTSADPPELPIDTVPPLSQNTGVFESEMVALSSSAPETSPDMSDIASFGNGEESQTREGTLRFNLRISGIDTVDIRKLLVEALDDSKLKWDIHTHMQKINNGELLLTDLTAVKSALIIQRLRSISVQLSWEQYSIHQA